MLLNNWRPNMLSILSFVSTVLVILLIKFKSSEQLSCRDENGSTVDWFLVYKIPKLESNNVQIIREGLGYTFITDKTLDSNDWTLSEKSIDDKKSIFGQTIGPLITKKSSSDVSYVVYNDQSPDAKSSSAAHSKGVFAFDSTGGFWFTHSVPKFPSITGSYKYPDNARHNGQTAICININANDRQTIDNIALQLLMMRPKMYGISIHQSLSDKSDNFIKLKNKKWIKTSDNSINTLKTKNGLEIRSFAKSNKFPKDLYSGLIATNFKDDLLVQSWRNGAGEKLDSDCTDLYKVQNIDKIRLSERITARSGDSGDDMFDWLSTEDHSKWLITSHMNQNQFTCISDINRMKSQFKRGGGSLCIKSDKIWKIFKKSIESIEGCKISNKKSEKLAENKSKNKPKNKSKRDKYEN